MYDHATSDVPTARQMAMPEPYITMAALAPATSKIKFGPLVSPVRRRHPALAAKMTSMLDVISNGRYMHGMGLSGPGTWTNVPELMKHVRELSPDTAKAVERATEEWTEQGYEIMKPSVLIEVLKEEIQIIKGMWTQDETSFSGQFYRTKDAINSPKPACKPHPPIIIGTQFGKVKMPKVAAEFAEGM
jgi:alkanesulfonate monooxygenase SsuD/methylene tetrahydromethanopterin reductase-like flavin-dependent oxidoreductase (luciferase family)